MKKATEDWLLSIMKGEPESEETALEAYREITEEIIERADKVCDLQAAFHECLRMGRFFDADLVKAGRKEFDDDEDVVTLGDIREFILELVSRGYYDFSKEILDESDRDSFHESDLPF